MNYIKIIKIITSSELMMRIMYLLILIFMGCFNTSHNTIIYTREITNLNLFQFLNWEGKAEIAQYKGKVKRYNQFRDAHLSLITVFEPFDYNKKVKSDHSNYYVIKQNQVLSYQTGVYPYRQMNSLFWNPSNLFLVQSIMTSQEWCGQSFKHLFHKDNNFNLKFHTYWEDGVEGEFTYKIPDTIYFFYDELPFVLRFFTMDFEKKEIQLFPLLMSSRINQTSWDIDEKIENPAFKKAIIIKKNANIKYKNKMVEVIIYTIEFDNKKDIFYFDKNHPYRILIKWERNDGGFFELDSISYAKYWELNRLGDTLP